VLRSATSSTRRAPRNTCDPGQGSDKGLTLPFTKRAPGSARSKPNRPKHHDRGNGSSLGELPAPERPSSGPGRAPPILNCATPQRGRRSQDASVVVGHAAVRTLRPRAGGSASGSVHPPPTDSSRGSPPTGPAVDVVSAWQEKFPAAARFVFFRHPGGLYRRSTNGGRASWDPGQPGWRGQNPESGAGFGPTTIAGRRQAVKGRGRAANRRKLTTHRPGAEPPRSARQVRVCCLAPPYTPTSYSFSFLPVAWFRGGPPVHRPSLGAVYRLGICSQPAPSRRARRPPRRMFL